MRLARLGPAHTVPAMGGGVLRRISVVLGFVLVVAAAAAGVWRYGYFQALDQMARQGASDLALASDRLTGQLQRYRELAVLVADHPQVQGALAGDDVAAEALFLEIADKTAAQDILLTTPRGGILAQARSGVAPIDLGKLVARAAQGALGWGNGRTEQGTRIFAFAAPVFDAQSEIRGAIVVTADLARIEWDWVG